MRCIGIQNNVINILFFIKNLSTNFVFISGEEIDSILHLQVGYRNLPKLKDFYFINYITILLKN